MLAFLGHLSHSQPQLQKSTSQNLQSCSRIPACIPLFILRYHCVCVFEFRNALTLSYTGGWIPPLLTLVLNSVSGIQAIVLMFGDFL